MNKEITIYELLGLMKDDKAPEKIKYKDLEYKYLYKYKDYENVKEKLLFADVCAMKTSLNDKVEILEEDEGIELLDTTQDNTLIIMECCTGILEKALDWNFNILKEKINELSKEVNNLRKDRNEE